MTNTAILVQKALWARVLGFSFAILDHGALFKQKFLRDQTLYPENAVIYSASSPRSVRLPEKEEPPSNPHAKDFKK
jgi:hypothetical protein